MLQLVPPYQLLAESAWTPAAPRIQAPIHCTHCIQDVRCVFGFNASPFLFRFASASLYHRHSAQTTGVTGDNERDTATRPRSCHPRKTRHAYRRAKVEVLCAAKRPCYIHSAYTLYTPCEGKEGFARTIYYTHRGTAQLSSSKNAGPCYAARSSVPFSRPKISTARRSSNAACAPPFRGRATRDACMDRRPASIGALTALFFFNRRAGYTNAALACTSITPYQADAGAQGYQFGEQPLHNEFFFFHKPKVQQVYNEARRTPNGCE